MRRCVTLLMILLTAGVSAALQIQCYQCEDVRQDDCSSPEFIVNCTVNVQDMCQKEVLVMEDGKDATSLPVLPVAMVEC
ncbi:hypothetical protein QQF64_000449 [Cirrhinus molitorella]|uniref:Uncharacterized protein n=2 Tax=Cirrhinus molitorella TaxID=172907 RepID=A0AA88Q444_9TELE|nr:hypothetical protein Q8A67_005421 [Cirrhinus molitorella]